MHSDAENWLETYQEVLNKSKNLPWLMYLHISGRIKSDLKKDKKDVRILNNYTLRPLIRTYWNITQRWNKYNKVYAELQRNNHTFRRAIEKNQ